MSKLSLPLLWIISCISQISSFQSSDRCICKSMNSATTLTKTNLRSFANEWLENKYVKNKENKIKVDDITGECQSSVSSIKKNDILFSLPQSLAFDLDKASKIFNPNLTKSQLKTGEQGMIALLLLYEKSLGTKSKYASYIASLPTQTQGILGWKEDEIKSLIYSTTRNIFTQLKAIDDDIKLILTIPTIIKLFSPSSSTSSTLLTIDSLKWAFSIIKARSVFLQGETVLVSGMDYIHFDPFCDIEPEFIGRGPFGGKDIRVRADRDYLNKGSKIFMSYGLKTSSECIEDHGYCPVLTSLSDSCCEIQLSIDENLDKFYQDKINVLDLAGLKKEKRYDLEANDDDIIEFDANLIRYLRLKCIQGTDAFILESCFANTVFDTLGLPFSKSNEICVYEYLIQKCTTSLQDINSIHSQLEDNEIIRKAGGFEKMSLVYEKQCPVIALALLRTQERVALESSIRRAKAILTSVQKGGEEMNYYQERRLDELKLLRPLDDSEYGLADDAERSGGRDY